MNALFLLSLIVEAVFGIGFILVPGELLGPMGVTLNATAASFARLFGSAIISFPILLFYARRSDRIEFRKTAVKCLFVYYLISTILLLMVQLSGQMNALGWSVVILHGAFTLGFGYFLKYHWPEPAIPT